MPRGVHSGPRTRPPATPEQLRAKGAKPSRIAQAAAGLRVDVDVPSPPPELEAEALEEWCRITGILKAQGLVTLGDKAAITAYVAAYQNHAACLRALAKARAGDPNGLAVVVKGGGSGGNMVVSPLLRAWRDSQKALLVACAELGLSPTSRQRLRGQVAKDNAATNPFHVNERAPRP